MQIAKMAWNPVYLHTLHFLTDLISQSPIISREALDGSFIKANTKRRQAVVDAVKGIMGWSHGDGIENPLR